MDNLLATARAKARQAIASMSTLSDARGASFIPSGHGGKHESSGTTGPGRRDGDRSLMEKWTQWFHDVWDDPEKLLVAVEEAELDYQERVCRKPLPVGEGGAREDSWDRDSRIIEWYEGRTPEYAARKESRLGTSVTPANIRAVRRRNDCDPELGRPQVPREQRQRVARELAARGMKSREIAREMNVSQSTVMRCLKNDEERAA
jgi:ribosome-binding protein aMBF1 (putative translation factor)